ncbi:hypothetical protein RM844_09065 [Streptomyces sp. DSM 44915]|uniref:Protein kilB n=1 Tax=Streptomyces chisholmiae TaxID=3075540 RepID=A0ABU2JN85_9ACTN|nr:hypothetical protein [Streptomyces sp. DSM 44915]MDT0266446.1 hypothetical protein [Streptomyces sp. DSM 44915]
MDQGWAAVLGAAVGALATGGGSLLTVRYARKTQKKAARREVYRAFLTELAEARAQLQKVRDLMFYGARDEADARSVAAGLREAEQGVARLRGLEIGVRLEGPDSVSVPAREVTQTITWMWARLRFAHANPLGEDEFRSMTATIEADFANLEGKADDLLLEAPRHL